MTARFDVAIVGAGAAGIAAARRLHMAGRSVAIIEAGVRVGGRAWTERIEGMALDLGCGWLHSGERNPWVTLAAETGFAVDRTKAAWGDQYRGLGFTPAERAAAEASFAAFSTRLAGHPPASDRASDAITADDPWIGYVQALSGYINGAMLDRLSIADYLAYDHAASDANWRLPQGYGALIAASLPPVPLLLATSVTHIQDDGVDVVLDTARGGIAARACIVTASTAVLASGKIRFAPGVDAHLHAAAQLPLGLADKLFIGLTGDHGLSPDTHLLGDPRSARTGSYYLMPFGRPVIEAFYGGEGAEILEREGMAAAFAFAAGELVGLLGSDFRQHLRPLTGSAWRRADWIGGSYSHALPGHASARAVLAAPASERLFFAGEATHATDFSTAHGAWHSGVRAAEAALAMLGPPA